MNDTISRQAALDALGEAPEVWMDTPEEFAALNQWEYDVAAIKAVPSTDRNGHWIYGEHEVAMCDGYRCDRCGFFVPWDYEHKFIDFINDYHFCPNCGMPMKGVDDE